MENPKTAENNGLAMAGIVVALLFILAACSPAPRTSADRGVPMAGLFDHNSGYFTGADPAFPHSGESGGGE